MGSPLFVTARGCGRLVVRKVSLPRGWKRGQELRPRRLRVMLPRHELVQRPAFPCTAETVGFGDLVAFRIQKHENRRVRARRELAQRVSFRIAARRVRFEYREVFRVEVLQLSAGELAGDVPAAASVLARIEDENVLRGILFRDLLRFLHRLQREGNAFRLRDRAHQAKRSE